MLIKLCKDVTKIHFGIVWSHSLGKLTSSFKFLFNVMWLDWRDSKTRLFFSSVILLEERGPYAGISRYGRKKIEELR